MPVLISLGLLCALWAFIVWERRRPMAPLSRDQMTQGFMPTGSAKWKRQMVGAALLLVLGALELVRPRLPPFAGKLAWLESSLHAAFGPLAVGRLMLAAGMLLFCASLLARRKARRKQVP